MGILEKVKDAPMSRLQTNTVILCLVMNLIDGYDLLVTSFVGPTIAKQWGLSGSQLGVLLSSGLAGMAIGAMFLAPLADRIGRRRLVLGALAVTTVSMVAASLSQSFLQLVACRVITGAVVGAMAACLPVLASEYASKKRRGLVVALITTGYGFGSVIAGLTATFTLEPFGWRAVFAFGAILTGVLFLVGLRYLPESLDYLIVQQPRNALPTLNKLLARMGHDTVDSLPYHQKSTAASLASALFRGRTGIRTILLWVAFTSVMTSYYFASSWTPGLLREAGMSNQQGISGGLLFNIGGIAGALLIGLLALRVRSGPLTTAFFCVAAGALVLFSFSLSSLAIALVVAVLVGMTLNGALSGLYIITPDLYPANLRATALGMAVAVSRLGAVFAPLVAGFLLDMEWKPTSLFLVFAIPAVIGAIATAAIARTQTSSTPDSATSTRTAADVPVK
ncbi:MFS transporter [Rhodococcus opacus]|uniref:MFS transporter n=1 Tax=Rhodococcus opacus TaxID=37919 RepID=UPI0024753BD2|nr:MFS transporter [Rhodococcus opacus]MDH6288233.1 benzoate transport [Rhodococcus opacus]